jgi:hypothetical protein
MNKDKIWIAFVQPLLGACPTCFYACHGGALAEADDCMHADYDGGDPACVDDWWEDDKCIKWKLASWLQKEPDVDKTKYVTIREINCMKCRKEDHCEVTFKFTEAGKVKSANVTRLPDNWAYLPYGNAGGFALYCSECLKRRI